MRWPWQERAYRALVGNAVAAHWRFDPLPDITVQELAWLWGNMAYASGCTVVVPTDGMLIDDAAINRIPANVLRHLKREAEERP